MTCTTTNILLSQWDRVIFEKLTATGQGISSFHETQRFTIVFTTASHFSTSSARWIKSTASNTVSLRFILILSSRLLTCLQSSLFSLSFPTNCPYPLSLVPRRNACPIHLTILLSQLYLAKIINYEALCWAYFSTTLLLPPSLIRLLHCCSFLCGAIPPFSFLFPLVPHTAHGGNGILFSPFEAWMKVR